MRVGLRVGRGVGAFLFFFSAGLGFGGDSVFFVASCGARAVLSTLVSAVAVAVRGLLLFVVYFYYTLSFCFTHPCGMLWAITSRHLRPAVSFSLP